MADHTSHIFTGQAPGRIDFLGGVADYSGGEVMPVPLRQLTTVTLQAGEGNDWHFQATGRTTGTFPALPWHNALRHKDTESLRKLWTETVPDSWVQYPLACLIVFARETGWSPPPGWVMTISSEVPEAMGVSSSAALEIATLRALRQACGSSLSDLTLAHLGQQAENQWVGAPCGLMDQLAASCGQPAHFLPIRCQPDVLSAPIPLPGDVHVVGWPSGVTHSVGGSPYGVARAAAFMGKAILEERLGQCFPYTAAIPFSLYEKEKEHLPEVMRGEDFLTRYGALDDELSVVNPDRVYPVRAAAGFPLEESHRVRQAMEYWAVLTTQEGNRKELLTTLGDLLHQSHEGYSAMGLGCPETDRMVQALKKAGPAKGIYGSRISGGGAGGTVVILVDESGLSALEKVRQNIPGPARDQPLIVV